MCNQSVKSMQNIQIVIDETPSSENEEILVNRQKKTCFIQKHGIDAQHKIFSFII
jgi:hypothetical protein